MRHLRSHSGSTYLSCPLLSFHRLEKEERGEKLLWQILYCSGYTIASVKHLFFVSRPLIIKDWDHYNDCENYKSRWRVQCNDSLLQNCFVKTEEAPKMDGFNIKWPFAALFGYTKMSRSSVIDIK